MSEIQETILKELIEEKRKDRRAGLIKTGLVTGLSAAYLLGMYGMMFGIGGGGQTEDYAAMVKVRGMIADGKDASYASLAPALKKAFEDPKAKGVVLLINSPGGTPVQSGLIHDLVLELKEKHKKPVIAVGEDMLTSGAYMIAAAADKIYANRSTVAGSIGVISAGFGFTDAMNRLGVERRVATAGNSKNLLDPFMPKEENGVAKQRELLEDIHTHFKDLVTTSRGDKLKKDTEGLFEGNVWAGDRAKAIGLVDELGSLDKAIMQEFKVSNVVNYTAQKPMLENLLTGVGVKVVSEAGASILSDWGSQNAPQVTYNLR